MDSEVTHSKHDDGLHQQRIKSFPEKHLEQNTVRITYTISDKAIYGILIVIGRPIMKTDVSYMYILCVYNKRIALSSMSHCDVDMLLNGVCYKRRLLYKHNSLAIT